MRRCIWLTLLLALLAGCGGKTFSGVEVQVYYASVRSSSQLSDAVEAETLLLDEGQDPVEAVLEAIGQRPKSDGLTSPLPQEVEVLGWALDDGTVTVTLSAAFADQPGSSRMVTLAALVLSLTPLEQVDRVTVTAGTTVLAQELSQEDILLYDKETDMQSRQTTLYFASGEVDLLVSDTCVLPVSNWSGELERMVMEELMGGPSQSGLRPVIPEGTILLNIQVVDGVCQLDMSEEFYAGIPGTAAGERLTIYAIVNSLTGLPGVDSVQFLREGESVERGLYIPLDGPVEANEQVILDLTGDRQHVLVYLWSDWAESLVELPIAAARVGVTAEIRWITEVVIDCLDELGYHNPVPAATRLSSIQGMTGRLYTIDLTAGFLDAEEPYSTAANALAAALTNLSNIDGVYIQVEGEPIFTDSQGEPVAVYRSEIEISR